MKENRKYFQILKSMLAILWAMPLKTREHKQLAKSVTKVQSLNDNDLFAAKQKSKDVKKIHKKLASLNSDFKTLFMRFVRRFTTGQPASQATIEKIYQVSRAFYNKPDKFKLLKLYQLVMKHEQEVLSSEFNPA